MKEKRQSIQLNFPETGIATYDYHIRGFNQSNYPKNIKGLKEYLNSILGKLKPNTIHTKIQALKKSTGIAININKKSLSTGEIHRIEEIWKSFNPKLQIETKITPKKVLSESEIQNLISKASPKLSLIIEFLYKTGVTVSELIEIEISKLSCQNNHVYIPIIGKRKKQRTIFISEELYYLIRNTFKTKKYLFETRNKKSYCRKQLWRDIRDLGLKVLGFSISPHIFRHSFASNLLLDKEKPLKAVSKYLGHSKPSVTADMYMHDELNPEDLQFSGIKKRKDNSISKNKIIKINEVDDDEDDKKTVSREDLDFEKINTENNKKFFVTCISPLFVIHDNFFKTILNYCKINNAELVILPMKGVRYQDEWDQEEIDKVVPYLATNYKFNNNLKGLDILLSPQQINPLTGLDRFGEKEFSIIIASPKQQMVTLTNTHNNIPHILHSTGMMCYNKISYRHNRIGKIASQDHILGGLIVEVKDHETFFIRQIQANQSTGEFIDLDNIYKTDSVEKVHPEAIYFGDSHAGFEDETAIKSAISQIEDLKPKSIFLGDVFDGHSISHHHINNITQQTNREEHVDTLEKELHVVANHIKIFADKFPDLIINIIRSNHDEHLDRYLNEGRYINDRINYKIALSLASYNLNGYNPIEKWLQENYPSIIKNVVFLKRDSSLKIANIECSAHGDISYNGIKATPLTLEKTYTKCIVGHAHTPKILRNVYVVGTMCKFKLSYTKGASSWNHTNCSIYNNGARQLLTTVNGDWRLK